MRVPELPPGYLRRVPLLRHLAGGLKRKLTALRAPAGFGKTTVLADIARDMRKREVVVGWISLDGDDAPNLFGSYLAAAFQHARSDIAIPAHDAWSSSPAVQQLGILARTIELHAEPCLLVLDDVDRLPRPTIQLLDLLVRRAPENLHVAVSFRSDPGLDLASYVFNGSAVMVGPQDFRFSRGDIGRFYQERLSRRELVRVEERTAGWPVALMVDRNMRASESSGRDAAAEGLIENYIGLYVLRDLSAEDRACLLDLAVFDCIDADLVRDVLGSDDAIRRLTALPALDGLLLPIARDHKARRLHPLLRDYCLALLAVENPDRRRLLHRRIALTLVQLGHFAPAWRNADKAGDGRLVGDLIERFGMFRLWLREGESQLILAGGFLTAELVASRPRLGLLRCAFLYLSSKFSQAHASFEAVRQRTDGFTSDRDGGDPQALVVDRCFAERVLSGGAGWMPLDELDGLLPSGGFPANADEHARLIYCGRHVLLCLGCYERARFDACRQHGLQAQAAFAEQDRFGGICIDIYLGMSAMAQGRAREAREWYGRAQQDTREFFSSDASLTECINVLFVELDLERNRRQAVEQRLPKSSGQLRGFWTGVYVRAIAVSAELTAGQHGVEAAVQQLENAVEDVGTRGMRSLSNSVSALLAHYLVDAERPDVAEGVWRDHGLPSDFAALLDLDMQSWHTMEALSCARIRLLAAQGHTAAAEELARALCRVASERGLVRTLLRGLALSMVAAESGGRSNRAVAQLAEFLRQTGEVDYIRPLVRHREISRSVLGRLLGTEIDDDLQSAAESMLIQLEEPSSIASIFSIREQEVLAGIRDGMQNKEIATRLGITDEGVRYHLRNIYRKTGFRNRQAAARYAASADGIRSSG